MSNEKIKLETAYFLTPEGSEMLDGYNVWKNATVKDKDVAKRREKLLALGLVRNSAAPIAGGIKDRVLSILEGKDKGLTLAEMTEAINKVLTKEGNSEAATVSQVRSFCNFYGLDHKKKGEPVSGLLRKDGDRYFLKKKK